MEAAWTKCGAVERDPGKVSGEWLFKGARVPLRALFENIERGATVNEFLRTFPGFERGFVKTVLSWSCLECQTWLNDIAQKVIQKRAQHVGLTTRERLIYCFWLVDYSMTNAGGLDGATQRYPAFREEAIEYAADLRLSRTLAAFSLPKDEFETRYFELCRRICNEIKEVLPE